MVTDWENSCHSLVAEVTRFCEHAKCPSPLTDFVIPLCHNTQPKTAQQYPNTSIFRFENNEPSRIWHRGTFICFPSWKSTCQDIVTPVTSHVLKLRVYRKSDISLAHFECTNSSQAVKTASTVLQSALERNGIVKSSSSTGSCLH